MKKLLLAILFSISPCYAQTAFPVFPGAPLPVVPNNVGLTYVMPLGQGGYSIYGPGGVQYLLGSPGGIYYGFGSYGSQIDIPVGNGGWIIDNIEEGWEY